MKLSNVKIHEDEFDVFLSLTPSQKLEFMEEMQRNGEIDVEKYMPSDDEGEISIFRCFDVAHGTDRMCIMQYDNIIRINSSSLKLLRAYTRKLWMDGLILYKMESNKINIDNYRFLRVYRIQEHLAICEN